ncbi:ROK family protein [Nonomuraea glycinis]|uniref:Transcriptional regulator n=1 Tax=Nonomuraea glycinis TaxID=2047744 RepID=A0A918A9E7_9ACTN|nr:ROK family protein [Nonomuraea glycinis]MCA2179347.1 ROK family protein [Nonomuraea glycinis]GGP09884.1 transcriptional regulator [Nonomuraea glycinis]
MNGSPLVVAVDIGGTKIAAGLVDAGGRLYEQRRTATPAAEGGEAIMAAVLDCARPLRDLGGDRVMACGIATAGVVDPAGRIAGATDLLKGWAGTDVRGIAERGLGLPAQVVNDCHAAGTAEARIGAARGARTGLVVAVGTGIGGALVADGATVTGRSGTAGAIGHVPAPVAGVTTRAMGAPATATVVAGRRCSCGAFDHVEAHASGPAIERSYREVTGRVLELREIASLARSGQPQARHVITAAASLLGRVLGGAANLLDPDVIVLAGGVSRLGSLLLSPVRRGFRAEALTGVRGVPIREAVLGERAGLVGAGLSALYAT